LQSLEREQLNSLPGPVDLNLPTVEKKNLPEQQVLVANSP
jgi:hypothetical protein